MVEIIHTYFWYGRLTTECTWKRVVIISKGGGEHKISLLYMDDGIIAVSDPGWV